MNPIHTVYLPINAAADWSAAALAWAPMDPAEVNSDRRQDGTAYLQIAGRSLASVASVSADPILAPGLTWTVDSTGVTFRVRATSPTVGARPVIEALWVLDNGDVLPIAATLPIVARAPAGLVPVTPSGASHTADSVSYTDDNALITADAA